MLILGTGGTHSTVTAVCRDGGAKEILTASRTGKDGALTYEEAQQHPEINIIINTTPAACTPTTAAACWTCMPFPSWKPCWTAFITRSAPNFAPCGGTWRARLLWVRDAGGAGSVRGGALTGQKLPEAVIADTHRKLKRDLSNVAIIGMPGCGKSTIGRALAKTLGKTYVDLDEVIEKNTGMPSRISLRVKARHRSASTNLRLWRRSASRHGRSSPAAAG